MTWADRPAPTFSELVARIGRAVEGVAATDPNPTDPFRGLYITDELAKRLAGEAADDGPDARLAEAARLLALDGLDAAILGICAAVEMSPRYGRLYAYLQDDVTRKLPSPGLVARLLSDLASGDGVLERFGHQAPLRGTGALRLLEEQGQVPLAERQVKVADRLAAFLVGGDLDDPRRDGAARRVSRPEHRFGREQTVRRIRALLTAPSRLPLVIVGPDAESLAALALEAPLLLVGVESLTDAEPLLDATLLARIEGRHVVFDGLEGLEPADRPRVLRALAARRERAILVTPNQQGAVALADHVALVIEVGTPEYGDRRAAWSALTGAEDVDDVAGKFRLSIGQIAQAAEVARVSAAADGLGTPRAHHLDLGARSASSGRLGELASRLEPAFGWRQLVLPPRPLGILRSISGHLRHRDLVLSEWGFSRTVAHGQGLKALFAGESGTGKTMAGQVIARELGLDLFRIDLATIVSKYIGETEKNLDRVFQAAEGSNAILFFDEADALFGRRSEVSDSHDRYANIEVAYLLQRMELYPGAVILATNFRQNIDDAFLRRLDFVVDFPFPEAEDRERIWRLVLPAEAPVAGDVDLGFLAAQFKLAGGGIRNAAMAAAFMAAEGDGVIGMPELVRGIALEYGKLGRLTLEADFERFHALLRVET